MPCRLQTLRLHQSIAGGRHVVASCFFSSQVPRACSLRAPSGSAAGDGPQLWTAPIYWRQSRSADKGRSSSCGVGHRTSNPSPLDINMLRTSALEEFFGNRAALYGCVTWSLALMVFEKKVLTLFRLIKRERQRLTSGLRQLQNEEFHNLSSSPHNITVMTSKRIAWPGCIGLRVMEQHFSRNTSRKERIWKT
jgi:hypothetical protein